MRLTSRNVGILDAGEYRDDIVPGLILRAWKTGRSWGFRYSLHGKRHRVDLGPVERDPAHLAENIEHARDLARLLVAGLVRGEDPRVALNRHNSAAIRVGDLCSRAIEALDLRPATRKGWIGHLRHDIAPELGDVPAAALSRDQIRRWGEKIAKRSGYVANRSFEVLRRAYSWAVENDVLIATPFVRLPKPFKGEAPREDVMTIDELAGLVQALDSEPCGFANAVELLLLTGVRKAEVRGARVAEFEGDLWRVPADRTKGGREHLVPLSRQAAAVFERQRGRSPFLFPRVQRRSRDERPVSPTFDLGSHYVRRLREQVGGSDWRLHGFRHALATHGQDVLGTDLQTISAILGHVTPGVSQATRIYARGKQLEPRREALQAWADWLDSLRWRPRTRPATPSR